MSERISTTELAGRLGISRQRVNTLAREGKLTREADGLWDLDRVQGELSRTLDGQQKVRIRLGQPGRSVAAPDPSSGVSESPQGPGAIPLGGGGSAHDLFNRARTAKEVAIAKEKQLDLRLREGELLEARQVAEAWTHRLTSFKNRLLAIPGRLAQKLAAITEDREVRALLDAEIRAVLRVLSETTADAA